MTGSTLLTAGAVVNFTDEVHQSHIYLEHRGPKVTSLAENHAELMENIQSTSLTSGIRPARYVSTEIRGISLRWCNEQSWPPWGRSHHWHCRAALGAKAGGRSPQLLVNLVQGQKRMLVLNKIVTSTNKINIDLITAMVFIDLFNFNVSIAFPFLQSFGNP